MRGSGGIVGPPNVNEMLTEGGRLGFIQCQWWQNWSDFGIFMPCRTRTRKMMLRPKLILYVSSYTDKFESLMFSDYFSLFVFRLVGLRFFVWRNLVVGSQRARLTRCGQPTFNLDQLGPNSPKRNCVKLYLLQDTAIPVLSSHHYVMFIYKQTRPYIFRLVGHNYMAF